MQVALCSPPAHHRARNRHIIPIALAASQRPTARDFVPWRFLDAGSLSVRRVSLLPASKNLHNCRLMHCNKQPHHSMSWSARRRKDSEIVNPSALAVLRLITSANLVGCWTGRSDGRHRSKSCQRSRGAPRQVGIICVIGHQATGVSDLDRIRIHCWQSIAGREFAHARALSNEYAFSGRQEPFSVLSAPSSNATGRSSAVRMS